MKPRPNLFVVGERVRWRVPGRTTTHCGKVVRVLPSGIYPFNVMANELHRCRFRGYWRAHESYVVLDDTGRHWWPRVSTLRHDTDD